MNLNSILPLLMNLKGGGKIDPKTMALIQAMSGDNSDKSSVISEFAGNNNFAPFLSLLGNNKPKKNPIEGLNLINDIANDDIFGKLSRYFYKKVYRSSGNKS